MHVAVIMDGNGRWAARRHLPRTAGHRAGAKSVDAVVAAAHVVTALQSVVSRTISPFDTAVVSVTRKPG